MHDATRKDTSISRPAVLVPQGVRLSGGNKIAWRKVSCKMVDLDSHVRRQFTDSTLLRFAKLYDADPSVIVNFAARNGVFGAEVLDDQEPVQLGYELDLNRERWS